MYEDTLFDNYIAKHGLGHKNNKYYIDVQKFITMAYVREQKK
jgi:hypothetical protein